MRELWVLAGVLGGFLIGQLDCCPREPELEDRGYTERWLEGTIGGKRVRMYVEHDTKSIAGIFYFLGEYSPILLGGSFRGGRIEMQENFEAANLDRPSLHLTGRMTPGGLTGVWTPVSLDSKQEVRLTTIEKPSCDVKGPMRVFNDPRWPIVFSYPESWHVKATGETIRLACPNPAVMAIADVSLDIQLHVGQPAGEQYRRSGGQWKYLNEFDCDREGAAPCEAAKVAERDGITVLGPNEFSFRNACTNGGSAVLAQGLDGQFVGDGWWIELRATGPTGRLLRHIVATARRR